MDLRCDLFRLEKTNMVTKMEDRIKVDLVAVSKQILGHLQRCDPTSLPETAEMLNRVAVQFNQGALLQYQYGEVARAEILCRGAIELFSQLSSYSPNRPLCLANMVAPYINLTRIRGQKGEVGESLSIFEDIYRFSLQQRDLSICGHRLMASDGPAMFAVAASLRRVMLSCRVIESARILQTVEDYPALLRLVKANEALPEFQDTFFKQYMLEVKSRALLGMGQYEMATEMLAECCRQMPLNAIDRIGIYTLLSQIYRESERDDLASTTLSKLEGYLACLERVRRKFPTLRQIAYRVALERHALGDDSRALASAENAFKWCSEWNDEPGTIKSAILLLRICTAKSSSGTYSPTTQRRWFDELQQLASTTFFRLECACAYWELGLSAHLVGPDDQTTLESACVFLQNSYTLYRSLPFLDTTRSCEVVKRSLDCRVRAYPRDSALANRGVWGNSPSIESTFDTLMTYVPQSS
jgi:tetratricopeptide (TPR) repeat protein